MQITAGQTVLLTGASGGLGSVMARTLARRGVRLALVAHPGIALEPLAEELQQQGIRTLALIADLRHSGERRRVVETTEQTLGPIDLLINNAGVEHNGYYHELPESSIEQVLSVNLTAAMVMTRWVLPGMLRRRRGHVVNISSLAGMAGPAFQEPYAASKAGLIAFTQSLRATYRGSGVSASVLVPGFVETGIYTRLKLQAGRPAPFFLRPVSPDRVVRALFRAVERDLAEVFVTYFPVRPLLLWILCAPGWAARLTHALGANAFFRAAALSCCAQSPARPASAGLQDPPS